MLFGFSFFLSFLFVCLFVCLFRQHGGNHWSLVGLLPLLDPPRPDTFATLQQLKSLGLKIKMLTGDMVRLPFHLFISFFIELFIFVFLLSSELLFSDVVANRC